VGVRSEYTKNDREAVM